MPILTSAHRVEIDNQLFDLRRPVLKVHRWLQEAKGVKTITYPMLVRYKNSRLAQSGSQDAELRRKAVLKDLAYSRSPVQSGTKVHHP